jgi:hypothetical protein
LDKKLESQKMEMTEEVQLRPMEIGQSFGKLTLLLSIGSGISGAFPTMKKSGFFCSIQMCKTH